MRYASKVSEVINAFSPDPLKIDQDWDHRRNPFSGGNQRDPGDRKKEGGSLRDLFQGINSAAKRAQRRESPVISMEDGQRAMEELKTALTKRIEEKDYDFLIKIF